MALEVVTVDDLEKFRIRLLADLAKMLDRPGQSQEFLRSGQVRKILNVSPGTLVTLRIKGILRYSKLNGSFRYTMDDVKAALEEIKKI